MLTCFQNDLRGFESFDTYIYIHQKWKEFSIYFAKPKCKSIWVEFQQNLTHFSSSSHNLIKISYDWMHGHDANDDDVHVDFVFEELSVGFLVDRMKKHN